MTSITSRKENYTWIAGEKKEKIISAIRNNNLKKFKELTSDLDLDKTFLVDEISTILKEDEYTGITILQQACDLRKKEIVSILLRAGATNKPEYNCSLDSNSKLSLTPFDITIIDKSFDTIDEIIDYGKEDSDDDESISNKRKKDSDDKKDSDNTYETPNSSLEYERY